MVHRWVMVGFAWGVITPAAHGATITVTTKGDIVGPDSKCSLREAITAANTDTRSGPRQGECAAGHGADVVVLPAGRYLLSFRGAGEDQNATGDLDLRGDIALRGAGAAVTQIRGGGLDRDLDVPVASAHVRIQGLTVTGGRAPAGAPGTHASPGVNGAASIGGPGQPGQDGGGIQNAGTLTILNCVIAGNHAGSGGRGGDGALGGVGGPSGDGGLSAGGNGSVGGNGGGIASTGPITITATTVAANTAGNGGAGGTGATGGAGGAAPAAGEAGGKGAGSYGGLGEPAGRGGGIFASGTVTIVRSTITGNSAGAGGRGGDAAPGARGGDGAGGGAGGAGGVSFAANGGEGGAGGGIFTSQPVTIDRSSLLSNHAGTGGSGGRGSPGGRGGDGGGGSVGGPGGRGATAIAGSGGNGGWGGGMLAGLHVTITNSTIAGNRAGSGGVALAADVGGAGGTGGASSGVAAGGLGGAGGSSEGGFGGSGGSAGGSSAVDPSLVNVTVTGNVAGAGSAGAAGGLGGAGGAGGRAVDQGGQGGNGGDSRGGDATVGGNGGGVISGNLVHVTAVGNAAGTGGKGGAGGTGGPGGPGGRQGGGGFGQHGDQGSSAAGRTGAKGRGGGGSTGGGTLQTLTLTNSLMANNSPDNCAGMVHDGGHNLQFPAGGCAGTVANPVLGPLQNNGGPGPTLALGARSAALNAIPSNVAGCTNTDERGVHRPQGPACDIGAYERARAKIVTKPASHISASSVLLQGILTPNAFGRARFVLARLGSRSRNTAAMTLTGLKPIALSQHISGLKRASHYRFELVFTRFDGTTVSAVRRFTTPR